MAVENRWPVIVAMQSLGAEKMQEVMVEGSSQAKLDSKGAKMVELQVQLLIHVNMYSINALMRHNFLHIRYLRPFEMYHFASRAGSMLPCGMHSICVVVPMFSKLAISKTIK
jgi:hypothetical protein